MGGECRHPEIYPHALPPCSYVSADVDLGGVAALQEALKQQGTKVRVCVCVCVGEGCGCGCGLLYSGMICTWLPLSFPLTHFLGAPCPPTLPIPLITIPLRRCLSTTA